MPVSNLLGMNPVLYWIHAFLFSLHLFVNIDLNILVGFTFTQIYRLATGTSEKALATPFYDYRRSNPS